MSILGANKPEVLKEKKKIDTNDVIRKTITSAAGIDNIKKGP